MDMLLVIPDDVAELEQVHFCLEHFVRLDTVP